MTDLQMMNDQLTGLIAKGKELRKKEAVFLKSQGINEEIEKATQDREDLIHDLDVAKKERDSLITKKNKAVAEAVADIASKMNEILPVGRAVFDIDDDNGGLLIGWAIDTTVIPYNGLSGGQKQIFDAALAHVLQANIIVLEAAELDQDHILAALEDLGNIDAQVLVSTCHQVSEVPKTFTKVEVPA
jgi:tetrahydromethanopterin S-methyltransferase subunit B